MKRILISCAVLLLLAGCAKAAPAPLRWTPWESLVLRKTVAAQPEADPHPVAAFLIEPVEAHVLEISAPKAVAPDPEIFLAAVRVTDPKGNPVEGLTCETADAQAVTDDQGRCLLPMQAGEAQPLQLSNRAAASSGPARYLVTMRDGAEEEELLLLWNGPVSAPAHAAVGRGSACRGVGDGNV